MLTRCALINVSWHTQLLMWPNIYGRFCIGFYEPIWNHNCCPIRIYQGCWKCERELQLDALYRLESAWNELCVWRWSLSPLFFYNIRAEEHPTSNLPQHFTNFRLARFAKLDLEHLVLARISTSSHLAVFVKARMATSIWPVPSRCLNATSIYVFTSL